MGTKSREVIWGGQIMGAKIRARGAREAAQKAARRGQLDHVHRRRMAAFIGYWQRHVAG
jgi:hypothetical protein